MHILVHDHMITHSRIFRGDSVRSDGVGSVSGEAGACVTRLEPLVEELAELERLQSYLLWLRKIHQLWLVKELKLPYNFKMLNFCGF